MLDMVEPQWKPYFDPLIQSLNGGVLVDAGAAADGWYSLKTCKMNPKIKIVALEPSLFEFYWLTNNLALNNCLERVYLLKVALNDANGIVDIGGEKVYSATLDSLLNMLGISGVKALKIDVEGMGYRVLKGAQKILEKEKPYIFLEVHNDEEAQAKTFLENMGYQVIILPGDMYVAIPTTFAPMP
jgi:hypothetical protein